MITAAELLRASVPQAEAVIEECPPEPWEPPVGASRAQYLREYHAWRHANDPAYRARRVAAALRAKARRKA